MEVETSSGNFQLWWFFDRPYSVGETKPVITALACCASADTWISCEHLFRVPDTHNGPTQKKLADGRDPEPYRARIRGTNFTVGKGIALGAFVRDLSRLPLTRQFDTLPGAILNKWPDAFDRATDRAAAEGAAPPTGDPVSPAILRDMLSHLDPDCDRDMWRNIVAAL